MTAVVGPVGVDHADLGDGGIAPFLGLEVILQELQVVEVHCKTERVKELGKSRFVEGNEARNRCNRFGDRVIDRERFGHLKGCLAALDRVDDVFLDRRHVLLGDASAEDIDLCRADGRTVSAALELNALCGGICTLIELTGKGLDREYGAALCVKFARNVVELRLGEDGAYCLIEERRVDVFDVVAVDHTQ